MTQPGSYRPTNTGSTFCVRECLMVLLFFSFSLPVFPQLTVLQKEIVLPRQQTTVYGLITQISRQTGHFFIYDSELIDNNRRVRIGPTTGQVGGILDELLKDPTLKYKVVDQHILIYRPPSPTAHRTAEPAVEEIPAFVQVSGRILDQESGASLPHATILIEGKGMGTTSNKDGQFQFRLPDDMRNESLKISYMGYKSQVLPIELIGGMSIDVMMETDYISMQEVIIRYYDPETIVREALSRRSENYSNKPVYHTSFYREGIQKNRKLLNYSEAIFQIYKSAYNSSIDSDQAVLLKSRKITNADHTDTLLLKIQAGVRSALELDIMRTLPAFLDPDYFGDVVFSPVDIVTRDSRSLYAIRFEETNPNLLPLYTGILFIDMESLALVSAEFEVHPRHLEKSSHIFIARSSRKYQFSFNRIHYTVQYQYHNGRYHLNHLRGDLDIRARGRNRLFGSNYRAFLEMVVCHIGEEDVSRFDRRETFRTNTTFIDQDLEYDYGFWGEYNIIPPEKQVTEAFAQIRSKIESIVPEE